MTARPPTYLGSLANKAGHVVAYDGGDFSISVAEVMAMPDSSLLLTLLAAETALAEPRDAFQVDALDRVRASIKHAHRHPH